MKAESGLELGLGLLGVQQVDNWFLGLSVQRNYFGAQRFGMLDGRVYTPLRRPRP